MRTTLDFWIECTFVQRKDIFTTETGIYMNKYGFVDNMTKKAFVGGVAYGIFKTRKVDLLNEIYYDILNFKENLNFDDIFEKIMLNTLEMIGCPIDNYWLYLTLDDFYLIQKNDIDKRIEVCKKSFEEIELYLPYLISFQNSIRKNDDYYSVGTLPDFVFCRDRLIYTLVDANRFEEAESYEKQMIKMKLFPDKNGTERLIYNKDYLLSRYIFFLLRDNKIEFAVIKAEEYKKVNTQKAAYSFLEIADYYFHKQNYEVAHKYYCLVSEMNPIICGIEKRIQKTSKILNMSYLSNISAVVKYLNEREKEISNSYDLLSLAQRYLDIEEYEKAIYLNEQIIKFRGYENTLLLSLSNIYKALANKKMKMQDYNSAINYYNSALNTLNKTTNSTKTIEKQIIFIKEKLIKLKILQV